MPEASSCATIAAIVAIIVTLMGVLSETIVERRYTITISVK